MHTISATWQTILRSNFTSLSSLLAFLEISNDSHLLLSNPNFPINIPRRLAEKMKKGSLDDPLFLQFVPLQQEMEKNFGFSKEPVEDIRFQKSARLLQKYKSRALIVTTGACAMNCRFCFRQNYPYTAAPTTEFIQFQSEMDYVRSNPDIEEVILSGGDPLSLSNRMLQGLFHDIEKISHIKRLRIHTRFPIGIPERIDEGFCDILKNTPLQVVFVLHINHAQELDQDVISSIKRVQAHRIPVLSQSVLLRKVNDNLSAIKDLVTALGNIGVIPYYLHQLDRVDGAHHFEVSIEEGQNLIKALQQEISGYLIPRYAQEIPGMPSKTTL